MRKYFIIVLLLAGCDQCDNVPLTPDVCRSIRGQIESVSLSAGRDFVASNKLIATSLNMVSNRDEKARLLKEWEDHLYAMTLTAGDDTAKNAVRLVREAVRGCILDTMYMWGLSIVDQWEARIRLLEWMQRQIQMSRPESYVPGCRSSREQWALYEDAVRWYENTVELFEFEFDKAFGKTNRTESDRIRNRLEQTIGRSLRDASKITRLGCYERLAKKKIEQEKRGKGSRPVNTK